MVLTVLATMSGCETVAPADPRVINTGSQQRLEELGRISVFLTEGMARIVTSCRMHFSELQQQARARSLRPEEKVPPERALAPAAIVLGFEALTLNRATEEYLLSHGVQGVEAMVMSALEAQRSTGERMAKRASDPSWQPPLSREQSEGFLRDMEMLCQPDRIRTMLTRTVSPPQSFPNIAPVLLPDSPWKRSKSRATMELERALN